jgi:predicted nucleic acid-binding protein
MMVIADTTPINYLILIGEIDVLPKLFTRVVLPEGVLAELRHQKAPPRVRQWADAPPAWVELRQVRVPNEIELHGLGLGEREAIALAEQLTPSLLLLDERKGYEVATSRNIPVVGSLFVLEAAGARGLIDLPRSLARLQQTTFRVTPLLIQEVLDRHLLRQSGQPQRAEKED